SRKARCTASTTVAAAACRRPSRTSAPFRSWRRPSPAEPPEKLRFAELRLEVLEGDLVQLTVEPVGRAQRRPGPGVQALDGRAAAGLLLPAHEHPLPPSKPPLQEVERLVKALLHPEARVAAG